MDAAISRVADAKTDLFICTYLRIQIPPPRPREMYNPTAGMLRLFNKCWAGVKRGNGR
jgi:hypothetical protein